MGEKVSKSHMPLNVMPLEVCHMPVGPIAGSFWVALEDDIAPTLWSQQLQGEELEAGSLQMQMQ